MHLVLSSLHQVRIPVTFCTPYGPPSFYLRWQHSILASSSCMAALKKSRLTGLSLIFLSDCSSVSNRIWENQHVSHVLYLCSANGEYLLTNDFGIGVSVYRLNTLTGLKQVWLIDWFITLFNSWGCDMAKLAQCQECDKLHITLSEKDFRKNFQKCLFWPEMSKNMKKNFGVRVWYIAYHTPGIVPNMGIINKILE